MRKISKIRFTFDVLLNILLTLLFLATLLIAVNSALGTFKKRLPTIFGFTVSQIASSSMEASGFRKNDFVVIKKLESTLTAESFKVRNGENSGDIIAFYIHSDWRPVLSGDDRSDIKVIFHEVIGVTEQGLLITKGSSNKHKDLYPIPIESVAGVYIKTNEITNFTLRLFLEGNRFLYWIIFILILLSIKEIIFFALAIGELYLQREVLKGRRNLLDKKCFEKNLFSQFKNSKKRLLINKSPFGMDALYEYLLFGRISKLSGIKLADRFKGRDYGLIDILCLTYSREINSVIDTDKYLNSLKKRKPFAYRGNIDCKGRCKREVLTSLSSFIGTLLFTLLYFLLAFRADYIQHKEFLIVGLLPIIPCLYFLINLFDCTRQGRELYRMLTLLRLLPKRYHFIVNPEKYTSSEITQNAKEIEERLALSKNYLQNDLSKIGQDLDKDIDEDINENIDEDDIDFLNNIEESKSKFNFLHRYKLPFLARIYLVCDELKQKYSDILITMLSYKGVKSRLSNYYNTFRIGNTPLLRINVRGSRLLLYFNLKASELDKKYFIKDMSAIKHYERYPSLLKVRSKRSFKYALELIKTLEIRFCLSSNSQ